jgi:hypothetical protein
MTTRQATRLKLLQQEQRILKQLQNQEQRYKHFIEWKSGKTLTNKIIKEYFANKIQNNQFIDPITLERISQEQGILLGHHIFQSKTIKTYIMTEDRENLLSLTIPGSVDEQEFIITLLGTHPENPTNRQPLTELDAKLIYHQLYTGTTLPYDEHLDREIQTRQTTKIQKTTENALGKKQRKKTKKYKKKKHKSKKNKN